MCAETPKEPASVILGIVLAMLLVACVVQCFKKCKKRRQDVLNNMAAALSLRTVSGMRVSNVSSVGQRNDVIGENLQQVSPSGRNGRPRRPSFQHVYEEIKNEDIDKMRRSFQSDRNAYCRDEIHHLDAGKLYNQHVPSRDRDMLGQNCIPCTNVELSRQSRSRRQTFHNRRFGFDDITLYEMASSGNAARRLRLTASVPCRGVLYRSGITPDPASRPRRHLKKEGANGPFELADREGRSPPTSDEDLPPPVPSRVGRPKLFPTTSEF
ncbi:Hypp987 [Branchiostoma lanceolatum]|uniref:Hypp987 protein n=1 Tax=Branchiostoma lanceolatum TaxID=7740 RepID=A0A8J9ZGJ6_BRALA|nr:Hypp987 [Branchiostoma lanceolatum]